MKRTNQLITVEMTRQIKQFEPLKLSYSFNIADEESQEKAHEAGILSLNKIFDEMYGKKIEKEKDVPITRIELLLNSKTIEEVKRQLKVGLANMELVNKYYIYTDEVHQDLLNYLKEHKLI